MDKISNILPGNKRVTTVDLENQAPPRTTNPNVSRSTAVAATAETAVAVDTTQKGFRGVAPKSSDDTMPEDKVTISSDRDKDPIKGLAEKEKVAIAEKATKSFWAKPAAVATAAPEVDVDTEGARSLSIYA